MATPSSALFNRLGILSASPRMPVMFAGHGNPMNAITNNKYHETWQKIGQEIVNPKAIVVISAHWETSGTWVTSAPNPKTIHDFLGFPKELFDVSYSAPGDPALAQKIIQIQKNRIEGNVHRGFDHGTWSILLPMFPLAKIPVVQLSLNTRMTIKEHYELAKKLRNFREQGVLFIGSGNMVHNLGLIKWNGGEHEWALTFDKKIKELILRGDFESLIQYSKMGKEAELSIPTSEHYLPMIYILGLSYPEEKISFFNEGIDLGSISMTSFISGEWKV